VPRALDNGDETVPNAGIAFANVNVTVDEADKKFVSDAFERESEQVPKFLAVTSPAVNVQFAVPDVTVVVTDPVPPPPFTATMIPVTRSPVVVATDSAGCAMRSIVIVVEADERESNTLSASRVAVTLQEPADVNVNCVPLTTHDAEPSSDTEYDNDPLPEPPEIVNATGVPYVPLVEVI
jgi:hypothetical protein